MLPPIDKSIVKHRGSSTDLIHIAFQQLETLSPFVSTVQHIISALKHALCLSLLSFFLFRVNCDQINLAMTKKPSQSKIQSGGTSPPKR